MDAFNESMRRGFENEMVAHLADFSPPLIKTITQDQLRAAIRAGIARASGYGFTFRGPVRLYLELMLLFGSHFDDDPQYPWARAILRDPLSAPQMQRAERLYEWTRNYRSQVAGRDDVYSLNALRRVAAFAREPLAASGNDVVPVMLAELARVYPQKARYVGADGLNTLIKEGVEAAGRFGFSSPRAIALLVVLMFAFGHGCCEDQLYPWISRTITDEMITDAEARARRLEKKAITWLDHVLTLFDGSVGA